jgi:hypothetical protein
MPGSQTSDSARAPKNSRDPQKICVIYSIGEFPVVAATLAAAAIHDRQDVRDESARRIIAAYLIRMTEVDAEISACA